MPKTIEVDIGSRRGAFDAPFTVSVPDDSAEAAHSPAIQEAVRRAVEAGEIENTAEARSTFAKTIVNGHQENK